MPDFDDFPIADQDEEAVPAVVHSHLLTSQKNALYRAIEAKRMSPREFVWVNGDPDFAHSDDDLGDAPYDPAPELRHASSGWFFRFTMNSSFKTDVKEAEKGKHAVYYSPFKSLLNTLVLLA